MKIIWTERSFHPNFGSSSHDSMSGGVIEVNTMKEAIDCVRSKLIETIKNSYDTEDEDEVNEIINEVRPIMPNDERNWGELYDDDIGYAVTYVIID